MVEAELLVACAALAWAFKFERKRLPSGEEIPINDYDFSSTLITIPKHFDMELVVRSEKHAQRILERAAHVKSEDQKEVANE